MAKSKKKTTAEKLESFKKSVQGTGYNSRNSITELADILYSEIEDVKKTIPTAKKSSK